MGEQSLNAPQASRLPERSPGERVPVRVLIIDNRDSFTFNLFQLVGSVAGIEPVVTGNSNRHWLDLVRRRGIEAIVLSPGPGSPERPGDIGICLEVVRDAPVPVLGVCLGHQGIGLAHGARVVPAPEPMHGRVCEIRHDASGLFRGIPDRFEAVRYHSLCLERSSVPTCLKVTATTPDGVVMAVEHGRRAQFGVQFHPESACSAFGKQLIRNFLAAAARASREQAPCRRPPPAAIRAAAPEPGPALEIVHRELGQWIEPQEAFGRLYARSRYAYWLDSSQVVPGCSRYSIMGDASGPGDEILLYRTATRTLETVEANKRTRRRIASLLSHLRQRMARPTQDRAALPPGFQTGLVGYIGYELRNELGSPTARVSPVPDAALIDSSRAIVFDHLERRVLLVARGGGSPTAGAGWFDEVAARLASGKDAPVPKPAAPSGGRIVAELADGPEQYVRKIRQCQSELAAGESYQICLSSQFSVACDVSPYDAYCSLRARNPAPHSAYLRFGDFAVLSSSPERFLAVSPDRTVRAQPIKGTTARSPDPVEDAQLAQLLRAEEKFRSENLTIVDLLRNDIGRVAEIGTVRVPELMQVESYASMHQLVSTVTGRLREGKDSMDCLAAAFPGGSMTGAPKLRTMSIIDRLEQRARGAYSGAIGYLGCGDCMDLSIVIRTIVLTPGRATIGSGGGIVSLSDPADEFEEMLLKARAPLQALAAAVNGDPDAWQVRHLTA